MLIIKESKKRKLAGHKKRVIPWREGRGIKSGQDLRKGVGESIRI